MSRVPARYQPPDLTRENELEGVRLASFRRRLAAFTMDMFIVAVLFMVGVAVFGPLLAKWGLIDPDSDVNISLDFSNWYSVVLIALYFSLSHFIGHGRTLGKRLFKLRVVSLRHTRLGFWHCVERALGYGASALEAGFGFFQVLWKPDRRATHDRIADTIVVDERVVDKRPTSDQFQASSPAQPSQA